MNKIMKNPKLEILNPKRNFKFEIPKICLGICDLEFGFCLEFKIKGRIKKF
jgi:hypothetical protein